MSFKKIRFYLLVISCFLIGQFALAEQAAPTTEEPKTTETPIIKNPETILVTPPLVTENKNIDPAIKNLQEFSKTYYDSNNIVNQKGHFMNDVVVAGNDITIDGVVEGDVIAFGNNINIKGTINGSVRAAGGNIIIDAKIKRNITVAGGQISITTDSTIGKDLIAGSGTLAVDGSVAGDLIVVSGQLSINNTVTGNANIAESALGTIGDKAKIKGNLEYVYNPDIDISALTSKVEGKVQKSTITQKKDEKEEGFLSQYTKASFWIWFILKMLAMLVVGLAVSGICKKTTAEIVEKMNCCFAYNILYGALFIFLAPIVFVLIMVTIIGIPLGIIGFTVYFLAMYIGIVFLGAAVGQKLFPQADSIMAKSFIGIIIVYIVKLIPILGGIIIFIGLAWAIGACVRRCSCFKNTECNSINKIIAPALTSKTEKSVKPKKASSSNRRKNNIKNGN